MYLPDHKTQIKNKVTTRPQELVKMEIKNNHAANMLITIHIWNWNKLTLPDGSSWFTNWSQAGSLLVSV